MAFETICIAALLLAHLTIELELNREGGRVSGASAGGAGGVLTFWRPLAFARLAMSLAEPVRRVRREGLEGASVGDGLFVIVD